MRRRIIAAVLALGSILLLLCIVLYVALPVFIRHEVASILENLGLEDATFDVNTASLWQTSLSTVAAGNSGLERQLKIGVATIDYFPLKAFGGEIESISIKDGRLILPVTSMGGVGSGAKLSKFPVNRIRLDSCTILLQRADSAVELPLNATFNQNQAGISQVDLSASLGAATFAITGTIGFASNNASLDINAKGVELERLLPVIAANASGITGAIDIHATHQRGAGVNLLDAKLTAKQITASGQSLSDLVVLAETADIDSIKIKDARIAWAGGAVWAEPFTYKPSNGVAEFILKASGIDVQKFLDIISSGRANGSGKINAQIPLRITGWPNIVVGDGWIETDGGGTLQLTNSTGTLGDILNQTDPRFGSDPNMTQVKKQILDALADFEFTQIHADLKRVNDSQGTDETAVVHVAGHGRTGMKQPLDITLNIRGVEQALNAYLSTRALVFNLGNRRP